MWFEALLRKWPRDLPLLLLQQQTVQLLTNWSGFFSRDFGALSRADIQDSLPAVQRNQPHFFLTVRSSHKALGSRPHPCCTDLLDPSPLITNVSGLC